MRYANTPAPIHGDTRTRRGFLFFPKRIDDETRWLEVAQWSEVWVDVGGLNGGSWESSRWMD